MTDHTHPLDRPVWNALTTRQIELATGDMRAVRFRPEVNLFGASIDHAPDSIVGLAALIAEGGTLGLIEAEPHPAVPGATVTSQAVLDQMVLTSVNRRGGAIDHVDLTDADAPAMLALATLTMPGPFFAETHRQGDYIGVKLEGRLIAMVGERTKPPGFTEVSAVCTHPDQRGKGFARALMEVVIARILARGEAAFLHTYPDNPAAALYRSLGFKTRREMTYTMLARVAIRVPGP